MPELDLDPSDYRQKKPAVLTWRKKAQYFALGLIAMAAAVSLFS